MQVFYLNIENQNDSVHVLNKGTGIFQKIESSPAQSTVIHAHCVDGIFNIQNNSMGKCGVGFAATSLKEFSLCVAYFCDGIWQLKYRVDITQKHGILCFETNQTFEHQNNAYGIPAEFVMNTALILGIAPDDGADVSVVNLRIFANETGLIDNGNDNVNERNWYQGNVNYDTVHNMVHISDTLNAENGKNVRFHHKLYSFFEPPTSNDATSLNDDDQSEQSGQSEHATLMNDDDQSERSGEGEHATETEPSESSEHNILGKAILNLLIRSSINAN